MSYPNTALNLSQRNCLFKPKPRYTSSLEEDRNSKESSSPRDTRLSESPVYSHYQNSYGLLGNSLKYFGNFPIPFYSGRDSTPHLPGMENDPKRISSAFPCNFECGSPFLPALRAPLPAVINGSHYNFNPYFYGHMKIPAHLQAFDPYFFTHLRKPKRVRTAFSPSQLLTLEKAFEKNHYVVGSERKQLAQILGLSETQVKVWFQNRRTKHKRQKHDGQSCSQKTNDKDCLDSRGISSSDEQSTSDDEDEETRSCNTSISPEIDVGNSLLESHDSTLSVSETSENSPQTVSNTIWNPIMLARTMHERTE